MDYPGTILFVSHDRYFINKIATKVIELSATGTFEYLGDYDYYVEKKQELMELAELNETKHEATTGRNQNPASIFSKQRSQKTRTTNSKKN